ncbi:unnamed protein product, partial [Iphiclides podalirius]
MANGHFTEINILRTSEWHGNRHQVKYEWTPKYALLMGHTMFLMGGGMLFQHWVEAYLKQPLNAAALCFASNKDWWKSEKIFCCVASALICHIGI